MALSPQEQTWAQLQQNLQRRQKLSLGTHRQPSGKHFNGYKKAPAPPLPRLLDSPTEAPLRGSHYPVIPPVANDRHLEDDDGDSFSLQSFDSEIQLNQSIFGKVEQYNAILQSLNLPYSRSGTTQGHHQKPQANCEPWNASTKLKRGKRDFMPADPEYWQPRKYQEVPHDGRGRRQGGQRFGGPHGRHVWRDPIEEAQVQHESATVVQKHYRGYRTRKSLEMLEYLQHRPSASVFMHNFLKDMLEHDIILDIVCEVLVEERTGRNGSKRGSQKVVNRLTIRHPPPENQRFWREALRRPDIYKPVAAQLLLETLQDEYRGIMMEGVNELVDDYFGTKVVGEFTNQIITDVVVELIPDVFEESRLDITMETALEELIDAETQACVSGFLEETFVMGKMPLDAADEKLEESEVARVAESYLLDYTFLDHLLLLVIRNGQLWSPLEFADRFLDDQLLDILLGQYIGILYNRQASEECVPLKRLHEKVVTDVALDVILGELSDQLVEDLEDVNESERNVST